MVSVVTADAHGVRVVTQVIPLMDPGPVECTSKYKYNQTKVPEAPYMTRMFQKGQPVALGTVQILIGIVMIALGTITWFTQTLHGEIPLSLGLCFILSGSVTTSAHKGTSFPIIKSAIALNIISALIAVSGICYFCFALAVKSNLTRCKLDQNSNGYYGYYDCQYVTDCLENLLYGLKGILLVLSVLEVCLCMTTVVFSCKANMHTSCSKKKCVAVQGESSSQESLLNREVATPPPMSEP